MVYLCYNRFAKERYLPDLFICQFSVRMATDLGDMPLGYIEVRSSNSQSVFS